MEGYDLISWLASRLLQVEVVAPVLAWLVQYYFTSNRSLLVSSAQAFVIFGAYLSVYEFADHTERLAREDRSKYGFESPQTQAWRVPSAEEQTSRGRAVTAVDRSTAYAFRGTASLRVDIALDGSAAGRLESRHKGEIVNRFDPNSVAASGSMVDGELTAVLYSADATGRLSQHPMWARLFAELCGAHPIRSEGPIEHFDSPGTLALRYQVPANSPPVCLLGVQVGLADDDPHAYKATMYLDGVDWAPQMPAFYVRHRLVALWILVVLAASVIAAIEVAGSIQQRRRSDFTQPTGRAGAGAPV